VRDLFIVTPEVSVPLHLGIDRQQLDLTELLVVHGEDKEAGGSTRCLETEALAGLRPSG